MDEHFTGRGGNPDNPNKQNVPPTEGSKDFNGYFEQRNKKVQGFSLDIGSMPDNYVPKYGTPPQHSDVFSYSDSGTDRKQADYMELTKSLQESEQPVASRAPSESIDDYYFGKHGVLASESRRSKDADSKKPIRQTPEAKPHRPSKVPRADAEHAERQRKVKAVPDDVRGAKNRKVNAKQRVNAPAGRSDMQPAKQVHTKTSPTGKPYPSNGKGIKKRKKVSSYSALSMLLGIACCLVFIASLTAAVSTVALSAIDDILAIEDGSELITVVIPEGAKYDDIIDILADSGVIHQKLFCKLFAKFRNFDGYTKKDGTFVETEYLQGIYYIDSDDGLEAILNSMKANYGTSAKTVTLSFPEGWSIAQIFEKLEKYEVCEAEKLYANLDLAASQYSFFELIPTSATRYLKCEGYLYPDTYEFFIGENANSVLKKLFNNFEDKWLDDYAKRAQTVGYTLDQILTVASILQREGNNKEQMKTISSIIFNRLEKSETYPQLQCDSTLNYANNYITPYVDSYYAQFYSGAYNTYSAQGLPPGPICNPGDDAIYAALYPDDTDYYYFCHDKDGNMYVASTYEEQRANVAKVLE